MIILRGTQRKTIRNWRNEENLLWEKESRTNNTFKTKGEKRGKKFCQSKSRRRVKSLPNVASESTSSITILMASPSQDGCLRTDSLLIRVSGLTLGGPFGGTAWCGPRILLMSGLNNQSCLEPVFLFNLYLRLKKKKTYSCEPLLRVLLSSSTVRPETTALSGEAGAGTS